MSNFAKISDWSLVRRWVLEFDGQNGMDLDSEVQKRGLKPLAIRIFALADALVRSELAKAGVGK